MSAYQVKTTSGGLVELDLFNDRFSGMKLYLHIDQSSNILTGEGDAAIHLNNDEVKEVISMLNKFIEFDEGKPYVILADAIPDIINLSLKEDKK